jgi:hypothetical protein
MTSLSLSLPVVPDLASQPLRISPTDVSQFVRLEQCERYLRFRLAERSGRTFMREYDVTPQRITPLLSLSGREFEESVETAIGQNYRTVQYADRSSGEADRPVNNDAVVEEARKIPPGGTLVLLQPRLEAEIDGWLVRGDVDVLRLERRTDGSLRVLIADLKSTTEVKVEHRLQLAFYHLMLSRLFAEKGVTCGQIQTGVLFRGPAEATPTQAQELQPFQDAARTWLGLGDVLLEVVADPNAYLQAARDLVVSPDSVARRVALAPFEAIPYSLSYKCDGCLYNEYCLKWSAEREDLSLLPYLSEVEKEALRRHGLGSIAALAQLKELRPDGELATPAGQEMLVRRLAATWPLGPRLDELVHRARSFRRHMKKEGVSALSYIPGKGSSTLPVSMPNRNPNLVRIYVEAQHDYLHDRVYLLGALVVACKDGLPDPARRRAVIHVTDGPPERASQERKLFVNWAKELVQVVIELAASGEEREGKKTAPLHLIFFDRHEQRMLLEGLARTFPSILEATPPLYDFLTQLAAFDSPVATFLDEEIRRFKNYPMTCQNLQSLATLLKFDWNVPFKFREVFQARQFDYIGKLDSGGASEWFTKRARFGSSVPLEYAYAAWGQLPPPKAVGADEWAGYRAITVDLLRAFQVRRLEAIEHVAASLDGNPQTVKTPFVLPDLASFKDKADDLAEALHEFVLIERLVSLGQWQAVRHAPPERRVLMGETLLVRYCEGDQRPEDAQRNREHQRKQQLRQTYTQANAGKLTKAQAQECQWSPKGLGIRLRLETCGLDCDLHDALALSSLREGDRLILSPRWVVDHRKPPAERNETTPTPKQLLYGQRCELRQLVTVEKDASGRVVNGYVEIELVESFGGEWSKGFVFPGIPLPLEDNQLYTLDPCPNDWYGYWSLQVAEGLCRGEGNTLYEVLADPSRLDHDATATAGQARFLAGVYSFQAAKHLHDFEKAKRQYIGNYGKVPLLLVQGPPGTGKSYGTAFALFARLQGSMEANRDFRAFVTCKTHAATDVLMRNMIEVRQKLKGLRDADPIRFAQFFDPRLLEVPVYRVAPHDPPPDNVVHLSKDAEKDKGEPKNADVIQQARWSVVAITPGGVYGMMKGKWGKDIFDHGLCDCLVLDEASQMNLPEAAMAALPLRRTGQLIVVGDHRQMPPIIKHDWDRELRRTFQQYRVYDSLFDTLRSLKPPLIQFSESFRVHATIADFLRQEVYRHDGIEYHSRRQDVLPQRASEDEFIAAVLRPEYPLVVVVHGETSSQVRNEYEQALIEPVIRTLSDAGGYGLDAEEGLGVVVPHRAQRAALRESFPQLCVFDQASGMPVRSAIDTVERFQGGERTVILVSATESDHAYLLASSEFLLDPRRLTVALSRAKRKMILVASRNIFSLFSPDEEVFANSLLWKNLLLRTCSTLLWEGERGDKRVTVWGKVAAG